MKKDFDFEKFKALNSNIQWEISYYIPYDLTLNINPINHKNWLEHNFKFFENGKHYIYDKKNHIFHEYEWNGKTLHIINGFDSTTIIWFDFNKDKIQLIEKCQNNSISKREIEWYENGYKKNEKNYLNGFLEGKYEEWYENGQKQEEGYCKIGRRDGKWEEWYENGYKKI